MPTAFVPPHLFVPPQLMALNSEVRAQEQKLAAAQGALAESVRLGAELRGQVGAGKREGAEGAGGTKGAFWTRSWGDGWGMGGNRPAAGGYA